MTQTGQRHSRDARDSRDGARTIPMDHGAEQAVLGAILLDHDALYKVLDKVKSEHFDLPKHRILFEAFQALSDKGDAITLVALHRWLADQNRLDQAGGAAYLSDLADAVPTAAHVEQHARIVRDKAVARALIRTCESVAMRGYDGATAVGDLLDEAEREVLQIASGSVESGFKGLREEIEETVVYIGRVQRGEVSGAQTGFSDFDQMTGGLNGGDLMILAARPSMGKTALALNIARNIAVDYSGCVGVFSLEMSVRQLILRLLMAEARIDFSRFRNGYLGDRDGQKLSHAANLLSDTRIYIDDSGALTVTDIAAKARRLHREQRLTALVIDYIQLIQGRRGSERREQEIAETTRMLKLLAKDLDIPVIALSQLNRGPEQRPNPHKRPVLADLRESGAIEQDADLVVFIYRDEFYNRDEAEEGVAELIVSKQRNGPTGTVKLQFEASCARFQDLHEHEPPPTHAGFDPDPFDRDPVDRGTSGSDDDPEPPF